MVFIHQYHILAVKTTLIGNCFGDCDRNFR